MTTSATLIIGCTKDCEGKKDWKRGEIGKLSELEVRERQESSSLSSNVKKRMVKERKCAREDERERKKKGILRKL